MAKVAARKKTRKKAKNKRQNRFSRFNLKGLLYTLSLLILLSFSIGVLAYVIFFRMVVAAELQEVPQYNQKIPDTASQKTARTRSAQSDNMTDKPQVAIIIDDMGYNEKIGESLIRLPHDLTFSFLPYAPFTAKLEKMAFLEGKTVMLHLPLEPKDKNLDPGPGTMYLDDLPLQDHFFQQNLSMVPHAPGINNHMGSRYTESESGMRTLLNLISARRLFFIDSFTSPSSRGFEMAQELGLRSARRNIFLDNIQDSGEICQQLSRLTTLAGEEGKAIGIAHPHQETLDAISSCIQAVEQVADLVGVEMLAY